MKYYQSADDLSRCLRAPVIVSEFDWRLQTCPQRGGCTARHVPDTRRVDDDRLYLDREVTRTWGPELNERDFLPPMVKRN